ncbi:hypothetical protein PG994_011567 [Apiospora phragmitis]|uniref:Uncharacterized protein n=1 Tax=Apiospora phragmitis TaxID=2905665 RepID=A0ABR1TTH3_9PEZI
MRTPLHFPGRDGLIRWRRQTAACRPTPAKAPSPHHWPIVWSSIWPSHWSHALELCAGPRCCTCDRLAWRDLSDIASDWPAAMVGESLSSTEHRARNVTKDDRLQMKDAATTHWHRQARKPRENTTPSIDRIIPPFAHGQHSITHERWQCDRDTDPRWCRASLTMITEPASAQPRCVALRAVSIY